MHETLSLPLIMLVIFASAKLLAELESSTRSGVDRETAFKINIGQSG